MPTHPIDDLLSTAADVIETGLEDRVTMLAVSAALADDRTPALVRILKVPHRSEVVICIRKETTAA